jgi:hypothetical protein
MHIQKYLKIIIKFFSEISEKILNWRKKKTIIPGCIYQPGLKVWDSARNEAATKISLVPVGATNRG